MFTDTHCHIYSDYYDNIDDVIKEAIENKVNRFFVAGVDVKTCNEIKELTQKYSEIYGTVGFHPQEISSQEYDDSIFLNLDDKIIAIGEIGLDYYWVKDNKDMQKDIFKKQLDKAVELNLPVVIHSRDATEDTLNILKEYNLKGVIHSFSGSYETALEYIKLGYLLGINGVVTFKNSKLKEVVEKIDLKNIILETDCPYLTPEPYRGKKNEPKNIIHIAKFISELKNLTLEEVANITEENIKRTFNI